MSLPESVDVKKVAAKAVTMMPLLVRASYDGNPADLRHRIARRVEALVLG